MESSKSTRIVKWLNIFLLIINLSAFTTFLLMNREEEPAPEITDNKFNSDIFLKESLELSNEQYNKLKKLDAQVFRSYQALLDMQCETHFNLLDELLLEAPSLQKLDSISLKIGRLHGSIKKQTIKHFSNIRSVCNEEQEELLDQLLVDMMGVGDHCRYCNKEECERRDILDEYKK